MIRKNAWQVYKDIAAHKLEIISLGDTKGQDVKYVVTIARCEIDSHKPRPITVSIKDVCPYRDVYVTLADFIRLISGMPTSALDKDMKVVYLKLV